jgi:ATP-dependent Lon protease
VITEYTREAGVRQLERELGTILRKTATQIAAAQTAAEPEREADEAQTAPADGSKQAPERGKPASKSKAKKPAAKGAKLTTPVKIDLDAVRDALGRQKFFQESAARTATPGVATGLAVTGTGGDVLFIEATGMKPGGGGGNGLVLTGQLGDVMKESARIALSYVRGHAEDIGIDEGAFDGREFHVHVPAGAIPKDGPSAGVAMVTALASLLSGRPVKHTVGMTGEVTLQGRVLPIGGLKQKALAAHAAGLSDVILPERNRGDLDEIPEEVREQMTFHPVMTVQEVLDLALEPARDVAQRP